MHIYFYVDLDTKYKYFSNFRFRNFVHRTSAYKNKNMPNNFKLTLNKTIQLLADGRLGPSGRNRLRQDPLLRPAGEDAGPHHLRLEHGHHVPVHILERPQREAALRRLAGRDPQILRLPHQEDGAVRPARRESPVHGGHVGLRLHGLGQGPPDEIQLRGEPGPAAVIRK